jgi:hypothetical protein
MNVKRFKHELVLLDDGRVLAIGGENVPSYDKKVLLMSFQNIHI